MSQGEQRSGALGNAIRYHPRVATPLPPGSHAINDWARALRLAYAAYPDEDWFRRWEPHDTLAPPARFFNAVTWLAGPPTPWGPPDHVVVVEPWYAGDDLDPLERSIVAFAVHPSFRRRAAMRVGEHFLTRVAFLESPPPPKVEIGDPLWDANVTTFAASSNEAAAAFHPRLRKLLAGWGFKGHIELRPGGVVVHYAGLSPIPDGYDRLFRMTREIVAKAVL